ncbi:hypothetical protein [Pseudogulbenkiania ferrooxidans]|uniref:hypothetical protein n=1 Tax=Pseudogulbenkiania ferrooxidans TaxID=549169 RepID=UPI0012680660|nr:hypothetical protein [Pseudogulbenkiania ferrooxidans]
MQFKVSNRLSVFSQTPRQAAEYTAVIPADQPETMIAIDMVAGPLSSKQALSGHCRPRLRHASPADKERQVSPHRQPNKRRANENIFNLEYLYTTEHHPNRYFYKKFTLRNIACIT